MMVVFMKDMDFDFERMQKSLDNFHSFTERCFYGGVQKKANYYQHDLQIVESCFKDLGKNDPFILISNHFLN